jgi:iron complex outermembrane receptor protein
MTSMTMTTRARALLLVWCVAAAAGAPSPASTEDEHETGAAGSPETVRVEGEGATAPTDLTGFVTTIHADQFVSRATSLADLLEQTVGLRVRAYGGLGSFATVSIRGSSAEQVNVYMDGMLMNPALGGGVNLSDISLSSVDTIEIYRGFTPTSLGSGAIGGAISIRSKRSVAGGATAAGSVSYGSYGTGQTAGMASWSSRPAAARPADAMVSADLSSSNGNFRFYDQNGTPVNGADDRYETRLNNHFWMANLVANGGVGLSGGGRVQFDATFARRRQGVPGIDAFQSIDARSEMTRATLKTALVGRPLAGGALRLDLDGYVSRTWQGFQDRSGGTTGGLSADTGSVLDAAGPTALLRWHPRPAGGAGHYVTLLASFRHETAQRTDRLNPDPDRGTAARDAWTLGAEDEVHFAGGRLVVSPSVRWEIFANSFDAGPGLAPPPSAGETDARLTGRLGAAWRPVSRFALKANVGRFFRVPSFTELFGDQGTVKGSDDLSPEEGRNYDAGFSYDMAAADRGASGPLDRLHLEASLFRNDANNLIQFVQTSQNRVVAQNTGRARVTGAEMSAAFGLLGWFGGDLDYTWQVATDRSDTFRHGSDLPGRPRHQVSARASIARSWGRPFYEFSYIGPNYFDAAASALGGSGLSLDQLRSPGRYLHNIGFTRRMGARAEMTLEVDNIFDVRTVDVVRYPLPGRLLQAKVRMTLP